MCSVRTVPLHKVNRQNRGITEGTPLGVQRTVPQLDQKHHEKMKFLKRPPLHFPRKYDFAKNRFSRERSVAILTRTRE